MTKIFKNAVAFELTRPTATLPTNLPNRIGDDASTVESSHELGNEQKFRAGENGKIAAEVISAYRDGRAQWMYLKDSDADGKADFARLNGVKGPDLLPMLQNREGWVPPTGSDLYDVVFTDTDRDGKFDSAVVESSLDGAQGSKAQWTREDPSAGVDTRTLAAITGLMVEVSASSNNGTKAYEMCGALFDALIAARGEGPTDPNNDVIDAVAAAHTAMRDMMWIMKGTATPPGNPTLEQARSSALGHLALALKGLQA
jgi:hypothetical protein